METVGIGGPIPFVYMELLTYSGTDAEYQAAVYAFNMYFSLVFEWGLVAFLFTLLCSLLSRS